MHVENIVHMSCVPTCFITWKRMRQLPSSFLRLLLCCCVTQKVLMLSDELTPFFFKLFRFSSHQNCVKRHNYISDALHIFAELILILYTILGNDFKIVFDVISFLIYQNRPGELLNILNVLCL